MKPYELVITLLVCVASAAPTRVCAQNDDVGVVDRTPTAIVESVTSHDVSPDVTAIVIPSDRRSVQYHTTRPNAIVSIMFGAPDNPLHYTYGVTDALGTVTIAADPDLIADDVGFIPFRVDFADTISDRTVVGRGIMSAVADPHATNNEPGLVIGATMGSGIEDGDKMFASGKCNKSSGCRLKITNTDGSSTEVELEKDETYQVPWSATILVITCQCS